MQFLLFVFLALFAIINAQIRFAPTDILNRIVRRMQGINPSDPRGVLVDDGLPDDDEDEDD
jgi:hypothetical protein